MGEAMEKKEKKKEKVIILLLILLVIILLGVVGVILFLQSRDDGGGDDDDESTGFQYDASVVTTDPETLQRMVDEAYRKAKEGEISLEMQVQATSQDGKNFTCYLGNSVENSYDMFMILYNDETGEEIYRSGLIPLGARIENFTLEEALSKGAHSCTLTYVQVEEDRKTIHAQVNIGLDLVVE